MLNWAGERLQLFCNRWALNHRWTAWLWRDSFHGTLERGDLHHGWDECTCSKYREWEDMRGNEPSAALSHDLSEESDAQHQNSEVWLMTMCFQCTYSHCISLLLKTVDVHAAEFTFDALLPNEVLAWVQFTSSLTAPNLLKMYPAILRLSSRYKRHFAALVF